MMRYGLILTCFVFSALAGAGTDDSWKLPLAEKEKLLEQNNVEHHNILGLYPSQVEVSFKDGAIDTSTLSYANIAHAVCWTSNYLSGASFRFAFLEKSRAPKAEVEKAKARADELFESIYRCQLVTGVRGLQARGYAIGHGETYEERWGDRTSDVWYQGAGEYKDLRWRGSPSHHNYSAAVRGMGNYYDLAARGVQKDRCREAIDALVGYWVDNDLQIIHFDKKHKTSVLGFTDGKTLNMRVMMAIGGAKIAYHATGNPKYQAVYEKLIEKYHVRGLKPFKTEKDFDDAEHVLCHLENLFRIETDPELLAAYRVVLDAIWANHKDDAQSLFTYIYLHIVPDAPDRDKALKDALFSLQTYPTDTVFKPTMSSIRKDLKPPYPVYAACWDNEYIWKGNLLRPDGWLSRPVDGVAVPAEDPMVIYAIDRKGNVFQSRDGATTAAGWRPIDVSLPSPAKTIAAGPRARMVFVSCAKAFYASTTGGQKWVRLELPEDSGKPVSIHVAPSPVPLNEIGITTPKTIYAVTDTGIYSNTFKLDKEVGKEWEEVKGPVPVAVSRETPYQIKPSLRGVRKSTDGGATWNVKSAGLDIPRAVTVFAPLNTTWLFAGTPTGLYISKDDGETWQSGNLVLQFRKNERYDLGGAAFIDAYWRARYYGFIDNTTANEHL